MSVASQKRQLKWDIFILSILFHLYLSTDTKKMKIDIQYRNKKVKLY